MGDADAVAPGRVYGVGDPGDAGNLGDDLVIVTVHATGFVPLLSRSEIGSEGLGLAHSVRNEASWRVATKTGFALEGTRRPSHLYADGRHDMHLHARLRGDDANG
ncbi:GNAT family protein [Streptomyces sp. SCL15-6]|uniref:GNAT family N-acetyltransferase n=1 Tax=Streptomyces sp. SCL15-6 TaxID=2967222 RepID=UPI00296641A5|nr:GNAT family protein [Streptomyces sp. SCL15-6]